MNSTTLLSLLGPGCRLAWFLDLMNSIIHDKGRHLQARIDLLTFFSTVHLSTLRSNDPTSYSIVLLTAHNSLHTTYYSKSAS